MPERLNFGQTKNFERWEDTTQKGILYWIHLQIEDDVFYEEYHKMSRVLDSLGCTEFGVVIDMVDEKMEFEELKRLARGLFEYRPHYPTGMFAISTVAELESSDFKAWVDTIGTPESKVKSRPAELQSIRDQGDGHYDHICDEKLQAMRDFVSSMGRAIKTHL